MSNEFTGGTEQKVVLCPNCENETLHKVEPFYYRCRTCSWEFDGRPQESETVRNRGDQS